MTSPVKTPFTATVPVRLTPKMKSWLEIVAKNSRITTSAYVRSLIEKDMREP
jgi:predicted DNA-binding protein